MLIATTFVFLLAIICLILVGAFQRDQETADVAKQDTRQNSHTSGTS